MLWICIDTDWISKRQWILPTPSLNVQWHLDVTPCKENQESIGFWIPLSGFRILCQWNLDSELQSFARFRIPWAEFRTPKPRIPDYFTKRLIPYANYNHIILFYWLFTYIMDRGQETMKPLSRSWHVTIAFLCVADQLADWKVFETIHTSLK